MIQDIAELVSLGLTVPTVVLSVWVVLVFYSKAIEGLQVPNRTAIQWFAMGIAIGFLGSSIDNIYWSIPWTASFLESEWTKSLVEFGVFPNVVFRQLCGIAAAYCHIRCGLHYIDGDPEKKELEFLNTVLQSSVLGGCLFVALLVVIK